jgi:hypothetical protein
MTDAYRSQQNLYTVLNLLKTYFSTTVFNDSTANLSLEPDVLEYPPGDIYMLITPGSFNSWQGPVEGGGNYAMILEGSVKFTIWFMNSLDEVSRDAAAMTNSTLGVYEKIDQVVNAIQMYDPCISNNLYLAEPMRITTIGEPRRNEDHREWVSVAIDCELKIWNLVTVSASSSSSSSVPSP